MWRESFYEPGGFGREAGGVERQAHLGFGSRGLGSLFTDLVLGSNPWSGMKTK